MKFGWCAVIGAGLAVAGVATAAEGKMDSVHDFTMNAIDGSPKPLADYEGKVLLIVNVASKCGLTKQYAALQKLYETYRDRGLVVLGFPANNFLGQEPGTNAEIATFCSTKFDVTFPMFEKISVKGKDMHPLYRYLTDKKIQGEHGGSITWNFNKFLVDGNGKVINRFEARVTPDDAKVKAAIEAAVGSGS
jgi:glutathione peroxidase-family protein